MATTYNIVRSKPSQYRRDSKYDAKPAKPLPLMGAATIGSVDSMARGRRTRSREAARCALVARLVFAFAAAQGRRDEAGMLQVIADMEAENMGALAARYRREIK